MSHRDFGCGASVVVLRARCSNQRYVILLFYPVFPRVPRG